MKPSQTVSPLAGILAAAGSGTFIHYQPGLPTDGSLAAIPSTDLTPAFQPTSFGQAYTGTLTAPETGTYILAITNTCGCYTPEYLDLNGQPLIDNPSTPPVNVYSVAVNLTAGKQYTLSIPSGGSTASALTWATPSDLAPGIASAVSAAKSAKTAVVVVSDDTESEATDRLSLNLPSAQDELISAVAAANPNTVVVVDAGAAVAMPWLSQVNSVLDAWYPGQSNGTALADVLFGKSDPSGHLPVTFPTSLSEVPASTPAQFPGVNNEVQYSEGIDVGYRWYDSQHLTPMFPFGFGLSYTRFAFSGLRVRGDATDGVNDVAVSATVTKSEIERARMSRSCTCEIRPRPVSLHASWPASSASSSLRVSRPGCGSRSPRATRGGTTTTPVVGTRPRVCTACTSATRRHWPTCRCETRSRSPRRRVPGRCSSTRRAR